jgi:hypothetical protein
MMGQSALEWELNAFSGITAEEYLLLTYIQRRNQLNNLYSGELLRQWREMHPDHIPPLMWMAPYLFWEQAREERVMRLQLVTALVETGSIQDKRAMTLQNAYKKSKARSMDMVFFGSMASTISEGPSSGIIEIHTRIMSVRQLHYTLLAMNRWYIEHGTLPESLDVLIEQGFLSAFPEHPFTGELMQYHRDAPPPTDDVSANTSVHILTTGRQSGDISRERMERERTAFSTIGGTYLRLGGLVRVILEPADGRPQTAAEEEREER